MRLRRPLTDRSSWTAIGQCPIEKAMVVVGSRPAMLIMREAHYGTRRFDDFVTRVGLSPATAATHLHALAGAGLLARQPYRDEGMRTRDEYILTEAGTDLLPVILGLFDWGAKHADGNDHLEFAHLDCGRPVAVHLACTGGHNLGAADIEVRARRHSRA